MLSSECPDLKTERGKGRCRDDVLSLLDGHPEAKAIFLLHEDEFAAETAIEMLDLFAAWFVLTGHRHYRMHPWPDFVRNHYVRGLAASAGTRSAASGRQRRAKRRAEALPGVTLVGFASGALGIGEDLRRLLSALNHGGVPVSVLDVTPRGVRRIAELEEIRPFVKPVPVFDVVIFCLPLFEMARVIAQVGATYFRPYYKIGYFQWELTRFPPEWEPFALLVDDIWCSTSFQRDAYRTSLGREAKILPLHVSIPPDLDDFDFAAIGVEPSDFKVLTMFDMNSTMARKNPQGSIQSFQKAFAGDENVALIIKTTHGEGQPAFDQLLALADADHRIVLLDGVVHRSELLGLIRKVDVFLSLHRAEGFGRILAESLALGTPVVATGWSGSNDYLTAETGFPVRYTLRTVGDGEYPFPAGKWAEPDTDHAATLLQSVRRHRQEARKRAMTGRELIARAYGEDHVARVAIELLKSIPREG